METGKQHDAEYVLGHSAQELERLSTQARLYEPFTVQFFRGAGIQPGMRVLDVGCGSGDVSFLTARLVGPTGQVVGVDRAPAAVATARGRSSDLQLTNTQFLTGDPSEMTFEEPFDAVVGRMVLMFCRDPAYTLSKVAAHLRAGGIIAFQEVDFSGCRSLPRLSTFDRSVRWIAESLERSGSDPYLGLKLHTTFEIAGLPPPALYVHAGIGAGQQHPLYSVVADLVRTLLPALEELAIVTAKEIDVDTLAERISNEAVAESGTAVGPSLVGAATRKTA